MQDFRCGEAHCPNSPSPKKFGANIDEIGSNYFNFILAPNWITVNQIFRDFGQKKPNHFLGQTLPIFDANKYEKKAKWGTGN